MQTLGGPSQSAEELQEDHTLERARVGRGEEPTGAGGGGVAPAGAVGHEKRGSRAQLGKPLSPLCLAVLPT